MDVLLVAGFGEEFRVLDEQSLDVGPLLRVLLQAAVDEGAELGRPASVLGKGRGRLVENQPDDLHVRVLAEGCCTQSQLNTGDSK